MIEIKSLISNEHENCTNSSIINQTLYCIMVAKMSNTNCINYELDHKLMLTWTFISPVTWFTTLEAVVAVTRAA